MDLYEECMQKSVIANQYNQGRDMFFALVTVVIVALIIFVLVHIHYNPENHIIILKNGFI
jgi:hypothetical protein